MDDLALTTLAAEALDEALAGGDSERALARLLRRLGASQPERALLARWVIGSSVLRLRLAHRLACAGLERTSEGLILAYRAIELGEALSDPRADRVRSAKVQLPSDPVERLAIEASLPRWIAQLWLCEQEQPEALAAASNRPGPVTLRANHARVTREALRDELAREGIATEAGLRAPHALHLRGRANLWGSAAWRSGLFEIQDEGSQMIVAACRPEPGQRWLDLCAGSGGKTLALAAELAGRGQVVACDIDGKKLENLRARVRRAGVQNVEVRLLEAGREREALGGQRFDGVLVDAPCSELGILRRHPDSRWRITPESIDHLPGLQQRLLEVATGHLATSGRLVYATCTLRRAENEAHNLGCASGMRVRTLRPDREGTDGFFIAAPE